MPLTRRPWFLAAVLAVVLASASLVILPTTASAALVRPAYAVGDRWVYTISASLDGFPGLNGTSPGGFAFELVGTLKVDVLGFKTGRVQVDSRARGFLNGSFTLPPELGGGTASITGTFTSNSTELWEDQSYFAVESNATSTYSADVTFIVPIHFDARIRTNATTIVPPTAAFPLDVGDNATADLSTTLTANTSFTFLGNTTTSENTTTILTSWQREVLGLEDVRVEAGTFSSYKLNQTLGSFPGIVAGGAFAEGNETAYFSNDVGYYTKRVAYTNGTPVAEMTLKSYSYGAVRPASDWIPILLILVAVLAAALFIVWFARRRRPTPRPPPPPTGPGEDHAR